MPYVPYQEQRISTILSLASFLLLLNGIRYVLDRVLCSGIIGEILIGIIWGVPVGRTAWLTESSQETVQALGYLGLIGLVFEGGLSTDPTLLRKTAYLSVSVATIGLLMPIALSFLLLVIPFPSSSTTAYPTPLASFSAGASLCSTSLGTTFAILSSANMQHTRVGAVLVGAAMMDDVVGLAMVNIITTLGKGVTGAWPIARPIAASFGLLLVTLVITPLAVRPTWRWLLEMFHHRNNLEVAPASSKPPLRKTLTKFIRNSPHLDFILSTLVLFIFVTLASFIDASLLLAAFVAGAVVKFLWAAQPDQQPTQPTSDDGPSRMYNRYYKPSMDFLLVPFFFVSLHSFTQLPVYLRFRLHTT